MSKKEFDKLTGKPLERQPYKSKIPKQLKEVEVNKKPEIKLNLSDLWNIFKAVFRNESLAQLEGKPSAIAIAYSLRYFIIFAGLSILFYYIFDWLRG